MFDEPRETAEPRAAGFTFVDTLLTIVIIGILAAVGIPLAHSALEDSRLTSAEADLATAVEYAQALALSRGRPTRVTFDTAGERAWLEREVDTVNLSTDVSAKLTAVVIEGNAFAAVADPIDRTRSYVVELSAQGWTGGVDVVSASFGGNAWVTFDRRGYASSSGTVKLASENKSISLSLDPVTGKLERL